ncbi:hypothetical protein BDQ17DRAFT_1434014 [Cyathus striatus]|nr:hypothetical protein BDQ17DRAFT_1434014 [Cyathus striatus]
MSSTLALSSYRLNINTSPHQPPVRPPPSAHLPVPTCHLAHLKPPTSATLLKPPPPSSQRHIHPPSLLSPLPLNPSLTSSTPSLVFQVTRVNNLSYTTSSSHTRRHRLPPRATICPPTPTPSQQGVLHRDALLRSFT